MESEVRETVACPHCGGTIKAAALRCKHCRSDIEAPGSGGAHRPSAPTTVDATEVARDMRALLVSRGVLSSSAFDALVAQHPGADASALLSRLCDAGHITALQIEFHREAFRERQLARLNVLLDAAVARSLLGASHAQEARAGFASIVFQKTPAQYLVTTQYLTDAQIENLGSSAVSELPHAEKAVRTSAAESSDALAMAPRYIVYAVMFGVGALYGVWWQGPKIISALVLGFVLLCLFVARRYPRAPEPAPSIARLVARMPPLARAGFISFALGSVASLGLFAVEVSDALAEDRDITLAELREAPRGTWVTVGHMQILNVVHPVASALRYTGGALTSDPLSVNRRTILVSWVFRPEYTIQPARFRFELVSPEGYVVENQRRLPARSFNDPDANRTEYLVFEVPWMDAAHAPGAFRLRITREWLLLANHFGVRSVSIRLPQIEDLGTRYIVDAANFNDSTE